MQRTNFEVSVSYHVMVVTLTEHCDSRAYSVWHMVQLQTTVWNRCGQYKYLFTVSKWSAFDALQHCSHLWTNDTSHSKHVCVYEVPSLSPTIHSVTDRQTDRPLSYQQPILLHAAVWSA